MLNQLRVIWMSYATRKINWVFFLLGSFLMLMAWHQPKNLSLHRVTPQKSTLWLTAGTVAEGFQRTPSSARRLNGEWDWSEWNKDLDVLALEAFYSSSLADPWDRIASMPNLRQLRLNKVQSTDSKYCEFLKPISRLERLEFLSLPGIPFTAESVSPWKSLTQLEWLVANREGCTFKDGIESLPVLPSLHTLEIHLRMLTPDAAEYLVKLPNLRTLILHDLDESHPSRVFGMAEIMNYRDPMGITSREAFETLSNSASLKHVYVPGREFGGLEDFAKRTLPNVKVRPLYVSEQQETALFMAALAAACWVIIPAFAVLGQFTRPESLLTPNYKQAHLAHAQLCILVAIAVGVAIAALRLVAWPIALATILGVAGLTMFCMRPLQSIRISLIAVMLPLQLAMRIDVVRIWLRGFLAGEHGWAVAFAMGTAGLYLLAVWTRDVLSSHRTNAENGVHHPVFTMQGWGQTNQAALTNKDQTPRLAKTLVYPVDSEVSQSI